MKINHGIATLFLVLFSAILLATSASAVGMNKFNITTTDFDTTNTQPTIEFTFNHSTNATADCSLYFDDSVVANNASVANNTAATLTPTAPVGFQEYEIYITCTDATAPTPITNQTVTILGNIHNMNCSGSERTIAGILIGFFMIGIIAFLGFYFMNGGGFDVKVIIGGVVILLLMVVMIAIMNPIIHGLCG